MLPLQIWVVAIYLLIFTSVGILSSRKVGELSHWVLAGRELPWWMIGPASGALMVAAAATVGAGGFAYSYGFSAILMFILAFIACFLVMSQLICPLYRRSGIWTLPDMFGRRYASYATFQIYLWIIVGAMVLFIGIEMAGIARIFEASLEIPFWAGCVLAMIVIFSSVAFGGIWSVAYTNLVHVATMYVGLSIGLFHAINKHGGFLSLLPHLGEHQIDPFAGFSAMNEIFLLFPFIYILSYLFLPFIHPIFVQVSASGKNIAHVRAGFAFGGILAIGITSLCCILGIYVNAFHPPIEAADLALPVFGMEINPLVGGFIYIGILSALLSTIGPFVIATSTIISVNIIGVLKKKISSSSILRLGRIFTFLLPVLSLIPTVLWKPSIIPAISIVIGFAVIVAPMWIAGFFWERATGRGANYSLIFGSLVFLGWVILRYPFGIHPVVPGVSAAVLALIVFSYLSPPPKYKHLRFVRRLKERRE
jgi:SSS family solute:Na+ symporter